MAFIASQSWTDIPDADTKIDLREKNVPWYDPKLKKLGPSARELLENYSKFHQQMLKLISIRLYVLQLEINQRVHG